MNATVSIAQEALTDLSKRKLVIDELKIRHAGTADLDLSVKSNYEICRKGIGELRTLRTGIEKRRKELVAEAVQWQREVNGMAKDLVADIETIEVPMQEAKRKIDDAEKEEQERRERERLEAEAAQIEAERAEERRKLEEQRAQIEADRKAFQEQQAKAQEEARVAREKRESEERARVEAEHKAALERQAVVDAERRAREAEFAAEREKLRVEREANERAQREAQAKIDEARRAMEAEQARIRHAEELKAAQERAAKEAIERAERERLVQEKARAEAEARAAAEAKKAAEMSPDKEKIRAFLVELRTIKPPMVKSQECKEAIQKAMSAITDAVVDLQEFSAATGISLRLK